MALLLVGALACALLTHTRAAKEMRHYAKTNFKECRSLHELDPLFNGADGAATIHTVPTIQCLIHGAHISDTNPRVRSIAQVLGVYSPECASVIDDPSIAGANRHAGSTTAQSTRAHAYLTAPITCTRRSTRGAEYP